MKALTFLEWFIKNDDKSFSEEGIEWIYRVADFYSQPFKPEMITELFEGDTQFKYFDENTLEHEELGNIFIFKPQTLNDFISDCNRAGIELTWKEGKFPI